MVRYPRHEKDAKEYLEKLEKEKMKNEIIINYCKRDVLWLVCRRTTKNPHVFVTIAECFTEESAEILYRELSKK